MYCSCTSCLLLQDLWAHSLLKSGSANEPKDTFCRSSQWVISPQDEICRGPVDGLVEGRIGVQVKGDEVLSDGGIIREGVLCDMLR